MIFHENPWLFILLMAFVGLAIGSFINVLIYRLPIMIEDDCRDQCYELLELEPQERNPFFPRINLFFPGSYCPQCFHKLALLDNIPLVSYFLLKGRCRYCKEHISWRYPIMELLGALLASFTAWYFGFSLTFLMVLILTFGLCAIIFIDFKQQLIPDILTLPLLWLGLLFGLTGRLTTPEDAILGAAAGYLFLWLVFWGFKFFTGKDGLGYGDFKLFAVFGAWLGWQLLPFIILLAAILGSLFGFLLILFKKHHYKIPIAFGPFIAISGWIAIYWGSNLLHWYWMLS